MSTANAWIRMTVHTQKEAEEAVLGILVERDILDVEITDTVSFAPAESGGLFGEVVPERVDDGTAAISFYVETAREAVSLALAVQRELRALSDVLSVAPATVSLSGTRREDWANNWKEHFHAFRIDDIEIIPTWEDKKPDQDSAYALRIDPGIAFGTGKHASTQLAIRALRKHIHPGDCVLDIGTGSGILGIVALKEGASRVFGTDLDENVPEALQTNLQKNAIAADDFYCMIGDVAGDENTAQMALAFAEAQGGYDIVVSNIIAEILSEITPAVPRFLKPGGLFITSGILQTHANVLKEALAQAGFVIIEENFMDEWESITARRED